MHFKKFFKIFFSSVCLTALYNKTIAFLADTSCLKDERGHFFLWNYGKVWYEKQGAGTPVVLLHDLTAASSGYEWHRVAEQLSKEHTVYIPDLPGCGRSSKPDTLYSAYFYVKFLTQFLEEIVGEPAVIITSGNSSSFALLSTRLAPERICKIICVNPAAPKGQTHALTLYGKLLRLLLSIPVFGTLYYNHCVSLTAIENRFQETYGLSTEEIQKLTVIYHESAHKSLRYARRMYASELFGYGILPVKQILPALSVPLTVLVGEKEANSQARANAYRRLNPQISVSVLPDAGHLPQLQTTDGLSDALFVD